MHHASKHAPVVVIRSDQVADVGHCAHAESVRFQMANRPWDYVLGWSRHRAGAPESSDLHGWLSPERAAGIRTVTVRLGDYIDVVGVARFQLLPSAKPCSPPTVGVVETFERRAAA